MTKCTKVFKRTAQTDPNIAQRLFKQRKNAYFTKILPNRIKQMKFKPTFSALFYLFVNMFAGETFAQHFTYNFFENLAFAHRGGYAFGPENTLKTIVTNIGNGVYAIEIDIMLTKDKQLVLFHDKTIERVLASDQKLSIEELSLAELSQIPLRDSTQGLQYICTLDQLVDSLVSILADKPDVDFLLELDFKPNGAQKMAALEALSKLIEKYEPRIGPRIYEYFFVSTFYPDVLAAVHQLNPKIVTAFAINKAAESQKLKARLAVLLAPRFVRKHHAKIIEPNRCMINEKFVKKWKKKGILINTYTLNTECQKAYIAQFKIAYTTNCPDGFCPDDPSDALGKQKKWCKKCSE